MVINFITLQNLLLSAIKVLFQTQSPFPKDRKKEKEKGKKKLIGAIVQYWSIAFQLSFCLAERGIERSLIVESYMVLNLSEVLWDFNLSVRRNI